MNEVEYLMKNYGDRGDGVCGCRRFWVRPDQNPSWHWQAKLPEVDEQISPKHHGSTQCWSHGMSWHAAQEWLDRQGSLQIFHTMKASSPSVSGTRSLIPCWQLVFHPQSKGEETLSLQSTRCPFHTGLPWKVAS